MYAEDILLSFAIIHQLLVIFKIAFVFNLHFVILSGEFAATLFKCDLGGSHGEDKEPTGYLESRWIVSNEQINGDITLYTQFMTFYPFTDPPCTPCYGRRYSYKGLSNDRPNKLNITRIKQYAISKDMVQG